VTLTLVLDLLIQNFNLGYIFWMVCTRTLIFHMSVCCDKTFQWVPTGETLTFTENLNIGCIIWMVCVFTVIFHECSLRHDLSKGTKRYDLVFVFNLHVENFNFGYNFWIVGPYVLKFIYFKWLVLWQTFPWLIIIFRAVTTDLTLWP
jgi:hypothetical protein